MPDPELSADDVEALLDIAEAAIRDALAGRPVGGPPSSLRPSLHRHVGAFVTLRVAGRLNGCIGDVDGDEPLGQSVARLALSAAFSDPRLPPLRAIDLPDLTIEVSILSPRQPLSIGSHQELLAAIRPGIDGVDICVGSHRGLFLPKVWDDLPDPGDFLDQLWCKAGLRPRTWPDGLSAQRFTATVHERRVSGFPR